MALVIKYYTLRNISLITVLTICFVIFKNKNISFIPRIEPKHPRWRTLGTCEYSTKFVIQIVDVFNFIKLSELKKK